MASSYQYSLSPIGQASPFDNRMTHIQCGMAILMRKLPRNTTREALRSMLLFAKDLLDADFVPNEFDDDQGFLTAVARFQTAAAATEAQAMLDGKPNTAGEAKMIVEIIGDASVGSMGRRKTTDPASSRNATQSASPPSSSPPVMRHPSSRFNGTFQSLERISPPNITTAETSSSEGISHLQTLFSPQSPVASSLHDRARISGKSVINQELVDDDTGELLKDPVAYMKMDQSTTMPNMSQRLNIPHLPLSRFASLSLNTNMTSPPLPNYALARSGINHQTASATSPNMVNMGPNAGYQLANQHYHRHNYPPVNPADQHPPCNTLYVGNLPVDTSEDELKAMFSKQRGYKRLCFRTKQNGPMCFVEFEDVSFATKALNELYGVQLHNSVKGGIRLSFSKNPLGVRAGQAGGANPITPLSPQSPMPNVNALGPMTPGGFSTANGPPPGLGAPPGLSTPLGISSPLITSPVSPSQMSGAFMNGGLQIGNHNMHTFQAVPLDTGMSGTSSGPVMGGMYPDYMMGR